MTAGDQQQASECRRWRMQSMSDILVVDDDPPIAEMIAEVLRFEGYAVRSAYDCSGALMAIAARLPALILLDGTMRDKKSTLLEKLCLPSDARVPIVVISAAPWFEQYVLAQSADFLAKPFDLDDLIACVARYVPRPQAHTH